MRRSKGSSLVQYAILLALMSIAVVGVYFAFGREINMILNKYLTMFTANNAAVEANAKLISDGANIKMPTGTVGPLGGTASNPVSQCAGSSCDIDFGSFVLKGVPENFGEFVVSNGSSGGIDELCKLIEQIASQIEATDPGNAGDLKDLANLGHFISDFAEKSEIVAKSCTGMELSESESLKHCFDQSMDQLLAETIKLPSNISNLLPNYNSYQKDQHFMDTFVIMDPATPWNPDNRRFYYKGSYIYGGELIPTYDSRSSPGMKFLEIYNKLKFSNLSSEQISVVDKLYNNISTIAHNHQLETYETYQSSKIGWNIFPSPKSNVDGVHSPETARNVDLKSALICVTGKRYDNGSECQK